MADNIDPRSHMPTKVYQYGLLAPVENEEQIRSQLRAVHTYRNKLVEIERARRTALRQALALPPAVAAAEAEVAAARANEEKVVKTLRLERAKKRARVITEPLAEAVREARVKRREATARAREARAATRNDAAVEIAKATAFGDANAARKAARAACGVYWGTYLLAEAAIDAAAKTPLYAGADPADPHFMRWTGVGRLGVQIQNGMASEEVGESSTLVRVMPREEGRPQRVWLQMRIDSDERGKPVWGRWPMIMHRPLPRGSRIKGVAVTLKRVGPSEVWTAEFTVAMPDVVVDPAQVPTGTVAVDLGWRAIGDEIRVATWVGSDGARGEIRLDAWTISGLRKPEELRAIRDKNFNTARGELLLGLEAASTIVPEWLAVATEHLVQWRSIDRLRALATRWKDQRFAGDETLYLNLEAWRVQDEHLWDWEAHQRLGALRHRREIFRVAAADLARRYGTLVIEKFDLRVFAKKVPVEADGENVQARSNRHLASPSEARLALVQAFSAPGWAVRQRSAVDTTRECNACHAIEHFDQAAELSHTCSACGRRWDQDVNASDNLLDRDAADPSPIVTEKVAGGKWARRKTAKAA